MSHQASLPDQSLTEPANVGCKKNLLLQWVEKGSNNCLGEGSNTGLNDDTCYGQGSGLGDGSDLGAITQDLVDEFEPFWGDEAMTENEVDSLDEDDDSLDCDYVGGTEIIPIVDVDVEVDEVALNLSDKDTCSDDSDEKDKHQTPSPFIPNKHHHLFSSLHHFLNFVCFFHESFFLTFDSNFSFNPSPRFAF
ncbi:hypothetical protein L6452_35423 [Arctium lappa]|uniref:Uncharacterized protein n=1 Tax=Arctium lappa TaxID=4217 RepID=A0ACB8Y733_ARCLA|nr:hypothetical protein L6452_35423 [Arctium lappa]